MGSIVAVLGTPAFGDAVVLRMLAVAPHRGLDTQVLVHGECRLGITQVAGSVDAALLADNNLAVAFTGVLDNVLELASRLELRRGSTAELSPERVLLAAFREFGDAVPNHLRGAYAAILTDGARLWCFRDHLGFAPLFYRREPGVLYVATEAKQVVAGARISREPDLDVVERIFYCTHDDGTPSATKGVERLPKATILSADADGLRTRRYWNPERLLESARLSEDDRRSRFDELMTQAVARTLTVDSVVSLSGGIDSPAVAAFAAPEYLDLVGWSLPALAAVYPQFPSVDERPWIELVAKQLGMTLHTYEQTAGPLDGFDEWRNILDDPVQTTTLAECAEHYRLARELGFRTMLTGELAELVVESRRFLVGHLLAQGRFPALWRQMRAQQSAGMSFNGFGRQLAAAVVPRSIAATYFRRRRTYAGASTVPDWLDPKKANEAAAAAVAPTRRRWPEQQLAGFAGPGISLEADEVCQAVCGIRVRRPWADVDLWEFFLSLPAEVKFPDARPKSLIRKWLRGRLPDPILDRHGKTYFDDFVRARIDYQALRRWLANPCVRIAGVNYVTLNDHLQREDLGLVDFVWAKDLAAVHAFLEQWEPQQAVHHA
jgi:asparagine synthase (glutamine-hydrolysing)